MLISLLRTVILYFAVIVSMRLMGKRQIGELEPSELVVAILISELAAVPMQDLGIPLVNGLVPIITLVCLEVLLSGLILKNNLFRKLLCGTPSLLIRNNTVDQYELKKLRLNMDELMEELRLAGFHDINDVKHVILETNGRISIIAKTGITSGSNATGMCTALVSGGKPVKENLTRMGLTIPALHTLIALQGYNDISDILYMFIDENGNTTVIPVDQANGKGAKK